MSGREEEAYGLSDNTNTTKESLFQEEDPGCGKRGVEPLLVSFEGVIGLEEEEKVGALLLKGSSVLNRGRMGSLRHFH